MVLSNDPQGSVAQRLTSSGIASADCYRAWGAASTTATSADVFGYGGQWGYYTDSATGLVLCTHRYYDPAAGRWLTRDPIGYAGGVNLYGYCGNGPVDWFDADGAKPSKDTLGWWLCVVLGFCNIVGGRPPLPLPTPIRIPPPITDPLPKKPGDECVVVVIIIIIIIILAPKPPIFVPIPALSAPTQFGHV